MKLILRFSASILALALLALSSPVLAAEPVGRSFPSRTCRRVLQNFGHDPATLQRVNEQMQSRYGFTCSAASIASRGMNQYRAARRTALPSAPAPTPDFTAYSLAVQNFTGMLSQPGVSVATQAEALTTLLKTFAQFHPQVQATLIDDLLEYGAAYFNQGDEMILRIRYNNNLSRLVALAKQSEKRSAQRRIARLIDEVLLIPEPTETAQQFRRRRQEAADLWERTGIVAYYWPGTPSLESDMTMHYALLDEVTRAADAGAPPGREHLHLLFVRDDVGATAGEGTLWLPTRSSLRAFIHETGHVVHFTQPSVIAVMDTMSVLHEESAPGPHEAPAGDFATTYHTDVMEDTAEIFTEYTLAARQGEHILDRALRQASNRQPLLLEKTLALLSALFPDQDAALPYYGYDGVNFVSGQIPVVREPQGRIEELRWRGQMYSFTYNRQGRLATVRRGF